jgi:PQQ-dependent dehydrogenase (methanol/ethanol family)
MISRLGRCAAGIASGTLVALSTLLAQQPASQPQAPPQQQGGATAPPRTSQGPPRASWPTVNPKTSFNWSANNLDIANSRYAPLDQINSKNVGMLAVRWMYHTRGSGSTPIVVDGVMYITRQEGTAALDAATGHLIWESSAASSLRGVAYGNGRIFVPTRTGAIVALDAKTGTPVESFGDKGVSNVLLEVLKQRYPNTSRAADLGYSYTMAPQFYNNMVIIGTAMSESNIPGGWVLAIDATNGKLVWKFNTIPQGPEDDGWEIAKDTWIGGVRNGGGMWQTPAVDAETGQLLLTVSNPSPAQDGSARKGINLFTNATVALDITTGTLKWYFQHVHHDIWDYDSGQQPNLFEMQVKGRTVKALASGNKNGYIYILNRETGQPINPIIETPVPTTTDMPGEEPWPTQPIPHTAAGKPMEPMVPSEVGEVDPRFKDYPKVPLFTPPSMKGAVHAPREAIHYGGGSFSPKTRLLYESGKELPIFLTARQVGATAEIGKLEFAGRRASAALETGQIVALDPATGEIAWRSRVKGGPSTGTLSTAGNLVFAADRRGIIYAFDATTGKPLWEFETNGAIGAGHITYQVNGVQYVAVPSGGDVIVAFALPGRR